MSDTPRMESAAGHAWGIVDAGILTEGMKLEREPNAANERIKRLEESENRLLNWLTEDCPESVKKQLSNAWAKAKEAKP